MMTSRWQIATGEADELRVLIEAERRRERVVESPQTPYTAPRSPTEQWVTQAFAEVLAVERVGVNDDFFALGGHSLQATQVIARLRSSFRIDAPLEWIMEAPTAERLGALVDSALRDGPGSREEVEPLPRPVAAPESSEAPFALTDVQQAYWLGRNEAFELGNTSTHVYLEFETSNLHVARLQRAWQRLVERHPMLRAVVDADGQQRVLKQVPPYRIAFADRGAATEVDAARQLEATRGEMSHQVFDAKRWPLFDIRVTHLPQERVRTHFSIDILIVDAGSLAVLFREWERLYLEPEVELPALELTFRDYILAAAKLGQMKPYRRSLEYWTARSSTLPSAPQLPAARSARSIERPRFVRRVEKLEETLWSRLKKQAAAAEVTPAIVLATVFSEVLATWSRSSHFTLNLTLFNRLPLHPQVDSVVGDFTSLTLLELAVPPGEDFKTRVRRAQKQLWADMDHRYVSGVEVLREIARRQSAVVTMPVVFTSMLGLPVPMVGRSSLLGTEVHGISQTPQVTLDHQVLGEDEGALRYCWDAVEDLFPDGMLDAMFEAYRRRLEDLAENGWDQRTRALVPDRQLREYARWNATEGPIESGLLQDAFVEQARLHPDRVAVVSAGRTLRYGEVAGEARRLARKLRELGVKPNELVAIVMERGWEQVVGVLGVLESGAAYVPVDAELPAERRFHLLDRCAVRVVVTQRRIDEAGPWPEGTERLCVDGGLEGVSDAPLTPAQKETDLAYVIFTSGSTGTPKGVMIEHRAALNTVRDVNERHGVSAADRVLSLSSLSFDLSVYDLFGVLGAGGAVILVAPGEVRDPGRWVQLVEQHGVTLWNSVPALMQMLVDHQQGRDRAALRSLRLAFLSGDWVPVGLADALKAHVDGVRVVSMGGATEASIWSIDYPIDEVETTWASIPYGRPMKNQRWYVLGEEMQPRPLWVPGELYIGGVGLARGYWLDPKRTDERFVNHPETGERLYRTGDWGRYRGDGTIEFLGREDGQVKIRGFRVELGEIEAAISGLPEVREALCTAYADASGQKSLAAYVVPREGAKIDHATIKVRLAAKLPEYMVPSQVLLLGAMPLSANGKVDRKALPSPTAGGKGPAFVAPRTEQERRMAAIWQSLLQKESVGITDNFFALGGHSLIALMVVSRAKRELGLEFPLAKILEHPTIETLLASLRGPPAAKSRHLVTLNPGGWRAPIALVSGVGGYGFVFQGLARLLGEEQPVLILNAVGAEDESEGVNHSIEELAAIYESQILAACPEGPVILGGYSFGILVAFEIARRFQARGRSVPLLVSFDGYGPCFPKLLPLPKRLLSHAQAFVTAEGAGRRIYIRDRLAALRKRVYVGLGHPEAAEPSVPSADAETDLRLRRLSAGLNRAAQLYRPAHSTPSDLLLIKTSVPEQWIGNDMDDPLYGWPSWTTGQIEVITVPGEHLTMFDPENQRCMADALAHAIQRRRLNQADDAAAPEEEVSTMTSRGRTAADPAPSFQVA
jgi:amino acid adenylation domain-containing protein